MNLICGFIESIWTKFYNSYVKNIPAQTRYMIGGALIFASILVFIFSTKGSKKGEMVGSWFLFWISALLLIAGVVYVSL
jgi:hypothetical protein